MLLHEKLKQLHDEGTLHLLAKQGLISRKALTIVEIYYTPHGKHTHFMREHRISRRTYYQAVKEGKREI